MSTLEDAFVAIGLNEFNIEESSSESELGNVTKQEKSIEIDIIKVT